MNSFQHQDAGHPLWAVGYVDAYGAVHARGAGPGADPSNSMFHSNAERLAGRPFRFNVWKQEYHPVLGDSRLSVEDYIFIENWLDSMGWLDKAEAGSHV